MRIAIYNENYTSAGSRAWQVEREDDWQNGDVTVYEGTEAELLQQASDMERFHPNAGGTDAYCRKAARTIREAL